MLYSIFMYFHAWPKVLLGSWGCAAAFNSLTSMLLLCYARCILVSPGTVPDQDVDPSWTYQPKRGAVIADQPGTDSTSLTLQEAKRSGDRRSCKWCAKYKPDRCHHCRVCRTCVLKMDHHCPWIYNCVGFGNHKYFFLLLGYTASTCWFIAITMATTLKASLDSKTLFLTMFSVLFGETLSMMIAVISSAFLSLHVWLMLQGMTTIEFCEKSMRRVGYDGSIYSWGTWRNTCAVLGDDWYFWLLPVCPPSGTGLDFNGEETPLRPSKPKATELTQKGTELHKAELPHPQARGGGTGSAPESDCEGS